MSSEAGPTYIALICNELGNIQEVLRDDLGVEGLAPGQPLDQVVAPTSRRMILNFLVALRGKGAAFDWEIGIAKDGQVNPLCLAGILSKKGPMVVFAWSPLDAAYLLEKLLKKNNEPVAPLHLAIKNQMQFTRVQSERDEAMFNKISRLNNELINLQRDLAKKNAELEKLNAENKNLSEKLQADIRESKRVEITLKENEAALKKAQQVAHVGSWVWHIQQNKLEWSDEMYRIFGIDQANFSGDLAEVIANAIHPDDRAAVNQSNQSVAEESKPIPLEYRVILPDGTVRMVWGEAGELLHDQEGKPITLTGIVQDITERKRMDQKLLDSERHYRTLVEGTPGIIYKFSSRRGGLYYSPRVKDILGYSPEQLLAQPMLWHNSIHPDDLPRIDQTITDAALHQAFEIEYRILDAGGTWHWFVDRSISHEIEDNEIIIDGLVLDITERKRTEEALNQSREDLLHVIADQKITEEMLSQLNAELEQRVQDRTSQLEATNHELEAFSYSVSHDLRAPLRGIDGWSLALLEDCSDQLDEKGRHYIERVREETERMGRLIDDLIRLSRTTRVEMKPGPVNLSELAQLIAMRLQEENPQRKVEVIVQPGLTAIGDPNLIEIVLTNLLSNAFKFSGKQVQPRIEFGKIIVAGKPAYFIRDNGAGFDMAFAKNLFGAFQRMHRQVDFPGTGIGLATVQRIILRHGGKVWAEARKNQGATFYFTLEDPS